MSGARPHGQNWQKEGSLPGDRSTQLGSLYVSRRTGDGTAKADRLEWLESLSGLESLRWYAAAAMIVYHVAKIRTDSIERRNEVVQFLNFGVPFFYVVSAFGLWYGYLGKLATGSQLKQFYRRRFFRIASLFYAMLCVYIVLLGFDVNPVKVLTSVTFTFTLSVPGRRDGRRGRSGWRCCSIRSCHRSRS